MGITGTNNVPLGKRRVGRGDSESNRSPIKDSARESERGRERGGERGGERERGRERGRDYERDYERGRDRERERGGERERGRERERDGEGRRNRFDREPSKGEGKSGEVKPKRRTTRWGDPNNKFVVPGMPTTLPSNMTAEQVKNYLVFLRMEEIGAKLRSNDIIPPEEQRSPSPEPVYNSLGQRVNTRDVRYKKKLEEERHRLIEQAIKDNPDFKPPADYRRPSKLAEKYFIPAKEHPDINFIGLLIGPRGNTLKKMETETGCKISIRGKGSVKEGKRTDAGPIPGIDEELHCLITGDTEEKVQKALKMVKEIIAASAAVPEGQNELKRQQLRELASLNGTLRDDESMFCQNCGASGHRSFECPDTENFTVKLVCKICNGVGHTASDCMQRNDPEALEKARMRDMKLDTEYLKLMNELGEESQVKKENNMENKYNNYNQPPNHLNHPPANNYYNHPPPPNYNNPPQQQWNNYPPQQGYNNYQSYPPYQQSNNYPYQQNPGQQYPPGPPSSTLPPNDNYPPPPPSH